MTREWKPGDVAMGAGGRAFLVGDDDKGAHYWAFTDGSTLGVSRTDPDHMRRLVVIDPEDRGQVDRLFDAFDARFAARTEATARDDLQAALRSLLAPEKPAEPQGLGAVVEDADGKSWVRVVLGRWGWLPCGLVSISERHDSGQSFGAEYADITAVKVLSEGVTA